MNTGKRMRVLFQNRPNAFTQRGGDTVVMERLRDGLYRLGVDVVIDTECTADPLQFDVVHLFNFALPEFTEQLARRAHAAKVPFVVTTLYEDVPSFHNQSWALSRALIEYQHRGQDREWFGKNRPVLSGISPCKHFDNRWAVENAAALFTNGSAETATVARDYGRTGNVREVMLACDGIAAADPALFVREYGVTDFILCVGRLETRKNQLMLLKALENVEIPVVLAGGGFSYQPEYEAAVRSFKRRGPTIVLPKISAEMLGSAYRAARVHALPSWYELPGLVTLEAAQCGKNVVVSAGTAADYLADLAFGCQPDDESSIRNAVLAAYYSPVVPGLKEKAQAYTWEKTAMATAAAYREIVAPIWSAKEASRVEVSSAPESRPISSQSTTQDSAARTGTVAIPAAAQATGPSREFQEALEGGEEAAKVRDFPRAHQLLGRAIMLNPSSVRAYRARGAVFLAQANSSEARSYFERALSIDAADPRALNGLAMCSMLENRHDEAHDQFVRALNADPLQTVALLQLVECAYRLNRFKDLENALRKFLAEKPDNIDICFCLAGALLMNGDLDGAKQALDNVVAVREHYTGADDLRRKIEERRREAAVATAPAASTPSVEVPDLSRPLRQQMLIERMTPSQEVETLLGGLDEDKRQKNFDKVKEGTRQLRSRRDLTPEQIEQVDLLEAEVDAFQGRVHDADLTYDRVLTRNPGSARAATGKGALAAFRGEWSEAERFFNKALSLNPNNDAALAGLGMCASSLKDYEAAWSHYQKALAINPECVRAVLGTVELGYGLRKLEGTYKALKDYLDLHPADLEFSYAFAGCCYAQQNLKEALDAVERILLFEPSNSRALELRDLVRSRTSQGEFVIAATAGVR